MVDALRDQGFPDSDFADTISKAPADPYWSKLPYMTDSYTSDVPALFVNSWYDFGADVTLFQYNWFRERSVSAQARNNQYVIMSPGVHCGDVMGKTSGVKTVVGTRDMGDTRFDYWGTYLTWFDYWLRQNPASRKTIDQWPKVRYFLMGENKWQTAESWPPRGTRSVNYYLGSGKGANTLNGDGTLTLKSVTSGALDSFTYDPDNPVPSLGGAMCCTGTNDALPGSQDQRSIEARNDVLVYTSEPLTTPVEVSGEPEIRLFVSSTAVDTDFTAKLVDVYPDGRAFNVLENILRARYRDGYEREVWMKHDEVYEIRIPLGATSNLFGKGHRIRVEVSSSNFPRFDRNLNVGGNNYEAVRWVTATNQVHHSTKYPSVLILPQTTR
jgi:putative CocE/NonD family hydrolase